MRPAMAVLFAISVALAQSASATPPDPGDPAYLSETPAISFTQELDDIISLYQSDPLLIYEYVRREKTFQPYFGALKDSQHVLETSGANDLDQATLLIALYRRMGIPAGYVRGIAEIPIARAQEWLGVTSSLAVSDILVAQGIPHSFIGFPTTAVQVEHVWVEAFLDISNYRGVPNGESPRVSRRLQTLRGWSHGEAKSVQSGGEGAFGSDGGRAR